MSPIYLRNGHQMDRGAGWLWAKTGREHQPLGAAATVSPTIACHCAFWPIARLRRLLQALHDFPAQKREVDWLDQQPDGSKLHGLLPRRIIAIGRDPNHGHDPMRASQIMLR